MHIIADVLSLKNVGIITCMYNRTLDCYVCYENAICTVSITNTNSEDTGRVTAHSVDDRPLSSKESSEREISVPLSPPAHHLQKLELLVTNRRLLRHLPA